MAPAASPPGVAQLNKRLTAGALRDALRGANEIYVSGCSAEIAGLDVLLDEAGIDSMVTSIVSPAVNRGCLANAQLGRRQRTFFLNRPIRAAMRDGLVELCPWSYSQIDGWMSAPGRFDAAVVMVSPPDQNGVCSLGTQVDFLPGFHKQVPRLVGIINPAMPHTAGDGQIALERFAATFDHDQPLGETSAPAIDPDMAAIAASIAGLVPDGATVQMGLGKVPSAVGIALQGHRRLRIRSGLVDDNILGLEDAGALDRDVPIESGAAIGTQSLYDRIADSSRFRMRAVSHTHDILAIARIENFISINGAVQVDLFGQLNSECAGGGIVATPGGFPEFSRGARLSQGGKVIIALKARRGSRPKGAIVSQVAAPGLVTAPRMDIDVVVTEFGVAQLGGLSLEQRADAIMAIADPQDREDLAQDWQALMRAAFS